MQQLLVGCGRRHEQAVLIADGDAADEAAAGNRGVDDGDGICELRLEDTVEVLTASEADQAVGVCQFGKDANLVAALEGNACKLSE